MKRTFLTLTILAALTGCTDPAVAIDDGSGPVDTGSDTTQPPGNGGGNTGGGQDTSPNRTMIFIGDWSAGRNGTPVRVQIFGWSPSTWDMPEDGNWFVDSHLVYEGPFQVNGPDVRGSYPVGPTETIELNGKVYFADGSWDYLVWDSGSGDTYARAWYTDGQQLCVIQSNGDTSGHGGEVECDPGNGSGDWDN